MKVIIDGNKETVLAAIRQRMTEILRGKELDKTVKLHIEVVRDIPNDPVTGKYKRSSRLKINHFSFGKVSIYLKVYRYY